VNVADIAKQAFDGVASAIDGVIKDAVIRVETSTYNQSTGGVDVTTTNHSCRVVFGDRSAIKDYFDDSIIDEGMRLIFIEGLAIVPKKTNKLIYSDLVLILDSVLNVAESGGFFVVLAK